MTNPSTRLLTLIMLLQRQTNQKAADLAAELDVSVRTLHRYFEMLDEMGIPIYAERGPYGGFSLVRGYKMPPLMLTPEESVAVALGTGMVEEMWGQLYREPAHQLSTQVNCHLHLADIAILVVGRRIFRRSNCRREGWHVVGELQVEAPEAAASQGFRG